MIMQLYYYDSLSCFAANPEPKEKGKRDLDYYYIW